MNTEDRKKLNKSLREQRNKDFVETFFMAVCVFLMIAAAVVADIVVGARE